MEEMFRLKIDGSRKTTIPQHLLNLLRLREGDEIRIFTDDRKLLRVESRQNTAKAHTRSAKEKDEFAKRVESVRSGLHDSEEDLLQALDSAAIGVGRT